MMSAHRRRLVVLTLAIVIACLATGSAGTAASSSDILGDADCSGAVNPVDGLVILRHDAGLAQAPCANLADVQCDGDVDAVDSLQVLRFDAGFSVSQQPDCSTIGQPVGPPAASEELIAAALDDGDITYEQSLLYRALALYGSPDLPAEYQSPVIDLESASELFNEIDQNEGQLSQGLLTQLAPYRARPNDPVRGTAGRRPRASGDRDGSGTWS